MLLRGRGCDGRVAYVPFYYCTFGAALGAKKLIAGQGLFILPSPLMGEGIVVQGLFILPSPLMGEGIVGQGLFILPSPLMGEG